MFNLFFEVWDFFSSKFGKGHQISLGKKPNFDPLDHKKTLTKKKKKKKKNNNNGCLGIYFPCGVEGSPPSVHTCTFTRS